MNGNKLKTWELSLLIALCITLCICTWAQSRQSSISSSLVRLHVLAVDDSEYEQALKLRVRDAVLDYLGPELDGAENRDEAESRLEKALPEVEKAAESVSEGRRIRVTLGEEYYPIREYEGFTLPAGKYDSLRVEIGEAKGHNWWCIVFPPLCLDAASCSEAVEAMDSTDYGIVTQGDGYKIKFRIVELWGELLGSMEK